MHIHDSFCRCRACKPPIVGERATDDALAAAAIVWSVPLCAVLWVIGYAALVLTGVLS